MFKNIPLILGDLQAGLIITSVQIHSWEGATVSDRCVCASHHWYRYHYASLKDWRSPMLPLFCVLDGFVKRTLGRSHPAQPGWVLKHTHWAKKWVFISQLCFVPAYILLTWVLTVPFVKKKKRKRGNQTTGPTGAALQPPAAYTNRNKPRLSTGLTIGQQLLLQGYCKVWAVF